MKRYFRSWIYSSLLLLALHTDACFAHHSFSMFHMDRRVSVQGEVKEFQWTNPHAWLQVMAPNSKGQVIEYSFELGSPNNLARSGLNKSTFKPGDKVTIEMHPVKDGSDGGALARVTFPDGRTISISPGGNNATITTKP
jgi:Family of unknown function (DUF6152)